MDRFQTLQAIANPQQQQQQQQHHPHQNGVKKEPITRISHGGHHHNRPSIDSAASGMSLYRKSFSSNDPSNSSFSSSSVAGSIQDDNMNDPCGIGGSLTQAGLEEYSRSYYEQQVFHHQKQSSYAQSEGYHSYVSSSDSTSTSATPFLDRLRQDGELMRASPHWSQSDLASATGSPLPSTPIPSPLQIHNGRDSSMSNVTSNGNSNSHSSNNNSGGNSPIGGNATNGTASMNGNHPGSAALENNGNSSSNNNNNNNNSNNNNNNSSDSTSSTETLKWLGSMSDVSVTSHATNSSTVSGSGSSSQLIAHSSRVRTPKRHNSESVLYLSDDQLSVTSECRTTHLQQQQHPQQRSSRSNHRLFPVSTYTELSPTSSEQNSPPNSAKIQNSNQQHWQSVADRINELERQHTTHVQTNVNPVNQKYSYLDPSKTTRVPNPTLKAFQKNAVQSYFERQQQFKESPPKSSSVLQNNPNCGNQQMRPTSLQLNGAVSQKPPVNTRSSLPNYPIKTITSPNGQQQQCTPPSRKSSSSSSSNTSPVSSRNAFQADCSPPHSSQSSPKLLDNMLITSSGATPSQQMPSPSYQATFHHAAATYAPVMEDHFSSGAGNNINHLINGNCGAMLQDKENMYSMGMSDVIDAGIGVPPPPPPRNRSLVRRTSSASEYASTIREQNLQKQSLSKDLLGPMIMGPIILVDDWVPERPPKNPLLRIPSPDLPPPPANTQADEHNQDEPLPPPPPELLRHMRQLSEPDSKSNAASRRNSFAGSPSKPPLVRASTLENLSPPPPAVPKKPSEFIVAHQRPSSSMAKAATTVQSQKAHKVILSGKTHQQQQQQQIPHHLSEAVQGRLSDTRLSLRKRTHNSHTPLEMMMTTTKGVTSPPPLKPRMPVIPPDLNRTTAAINNKLRSTSKASYLPRQSHSREKITPDPDHGSYKLTLTSNEDCIINHTNHNGTSNHNNNNTFHNHHHQDELLASKCANLPDVLPVNAKIHSASQRYGSNNNININNNNNLKNLSHGPPSPKQQSPQTAPIMSTHHHHQQQQQQQQQQHHHHPMKSMFQFQMNGHNHNNKTNSSPPLSPSRTAPSPPSGQHYNTTSSSTASSPSASSSPSSRSSSESISPKYMSQSTIDLKKMHVMSSVSVSRLSPAESDGNLTELDHVTRTPSLPAYGSISTSSLVRTEPPKKVAVCRKISLDEGSPTVMLREKSGGEKIIRKDSLKDNIDKITQLQTKLMSAHLNGEAERRISLARNPSNASTTSAGSLDAKPPVAPIKPIAVRVENVMVTNIENGVTMDAKRLESLGVTKFNSNESRVSPPIQMDQETDGLKLMQRTEVILRVNAATSEASSQTDDQIEAILQQSSPQKSISLSFSEAPPPMITIDVRTPLMPRKKLPEEIDCEELSSDLVSQLSPTDKLHSILAPKSFKSTKDYVSGLYNTLVTPRPARREIATSTEDRDVSDATPVEKSSTTTTEPLTTNATYLTVSDSKAKLMTRYNREMTLVNGDCGDLTKKKHELVERLTKKLSVLATEQTTIVEEVTANDLLGADVAEKVSQKVRPSEASKFRSYVDDVGHITMLLLSLSGRLARAENALQNIPDNHGDKKTLAVKRDRLLEQLTEAKFLKDDIDRRGSAIAKILEQNLQIEEYADYDYFINMKAKLIVDAREVSDKIKLGEEQLMALKETLVHSEC